MIIKILIGLLIFIFIYALIILLCSFDYDTNNAKYVLVLGHKLENDTADQVLKYRLKKAIKYLDNNPNTKVILSGGITKGNTISEASYMKDYLIKNMQQLKQVYWKKRSKVVVYALREEYDKIICRGCKGQNFSVFVIAEQNLAK